MFNTREVLEIKNHNWVVPEVRVKKNIFSEKNKRALFCNPTWSLQDLAGQSFATEQDEKYYTVEDIQTRI